MGGAHAVPGQPGAHAVPAWPGGSGVESVSPRRPPAPRAWDPALPLPIGAQRALPAASELRGPPSFENQRPCFQTMFIMTREPPACNNNASLAVWSPRPGGGGAGRSRGLVGAEVPLPCVAGRSASFPRRPEGGARRGCRSSSPPTPWGPWGRPRPLAACTRSLPGSPCPRPRRRSTVRSPSGFSFVSGPSWGLGAKKPGAVVAPESWILALHCSELRSDSG